MTTKQFLGAVAMLIVFCCASAKPTKATTRRPAEYSRGEAVTRTAREIIWLPLPFVSVRVTMHGPAGR